MNMQTWKKDIIAILKRELTPDYILLFGSHAKGTEREDSDLDIAYSSSVNLTDYERFMLAQEIAIVLNKDVDLIDLRQVDTVFAVQIYYYGELIECNNEDAFVRDRMKALSMYAALNEQRTEVLKDVEKRGRVYDE